MTTNFPQSEAQFLSLAHNVLRVWSLPPLSLHFLLFSVSCALTSLLFLHLGPLQWLFPCLESSSGCHIAPPFTSFPSHLLNEASSDHLFKVSILFFRISSSHRSSFFFTYYIMSLLYLSVLLIKT